MAVPLLRRRFVSGRRNAGARLAASARLIPGARLVAGGVLRQGEFGFPVETYRFSQSVCL
jgi:hypothetical protein